MSEMIFKGSLSFSDNHHGKTRATHKKPIVVGTQNDREDEQTVPGNDTDKGRKLHEQSPRLSLSRYCLAPNY
ncbi:MAG: hypothetical protein VX107_17485, partial [Pseudomonadota bacterium]|nr:hypothetical protein [Pseudomonadota bacterium]